MTASKLIVAMGVICLCIVLAQGASEIAERFPLSSWMGHPMVLTKTPMELTFPASHNASTYEVKNKKVPTGAVKCQKIPVIGQLEAGVRALDVRVNCGEDETIKTGHNGIRCADFKEVLIDVIKFLEKNKTEIVFLRVKQDKGGNMAIEDIKDRVINAFEQLEKKSSLAYTTQDEVSDTKIEDIVESNERLVFMFVGDDDHYNVEGTYRHIKTGNPKQLMKNIQEHSEKVYDRQDDSTHYRWLSMQVTCFMKAFFTGYEKRATESADCACSDPDLLYNITKVTRIAATREKPFNKLFNFVGMDMVGTSRQISHFIKKIIKANQVKKHIFQIRPKKSKESLLTIGEERDYPSIPDTESDSEGSVTVSEFVSDSSSTRRRLQVCMYDHELRQLLATATKN